MCAELTVGGERAARLLVSVSRLSARWPHINHHPRLSDKLSSAVNACLPQTDDFIKSSYLILRNNFTKLPQTCLVSDTL